jgi:hypothetical protein
MARVPDDHCCAHVPESAADFQAVGVERLLVLHHVTRTKAAAREPLRPRITPHFEERVGPAESDDVTG